MEPVELTSKGFDLLTLFATNPGKPFNREQLLNRSGVSILLIEQNAVQALQLSHRGYVLEHGHLIAEGEAQSLLGDDNIKSAYLGI